MEKPISVSVFYGKDFQARNARNGNEQEQRRRAARIPRKGRRAPAPFG